MKKDLRLRITTIVLIVAATLMFAGISSADSKVLRLVTWTGYAPPELIEKFEKETTPVK